MRRTLLGSLATLLALAGLQLGMTLRDQIPSQNEALADRGLSSAAAIGGASGGPGVVRSGNLVQVARSPLYTVQVLGLYDIFLAGKSYPFVVSGRYGRDTAGRNTPSQLAVTSRAGTAVTISVQTIVRPPHAADANGRVQAVFLAGLKEPGASASAVSSVIGPQYSLVAVFTAKTAGGLIPGTLDFRTLAARDGRILLPKLNQVFFVGTGKTSKGVPKVFIVPKGAAHLWLGILDHLGANHSSKSAFQVSVVGNAPAIPQYAPIPLPTASLTATMAPTAIPTVPTVPTLTATATFNGTVLPVDTVFPTDTPSPAITPLQPLATDTPAVATASAVPGATGTAAAVITATAQSAATASVTATVSATLTGTPSATLTATGTVTPTATLLIFPTPH